MSEKPRLTEFADALREAHNTPAKTVITAKTVRRSRGRPTQKQTPGTKQTYYLHQETLEELDELLYRLKKLAPPAKRGTVNKSLIMESAVQAALNDVINKDKNSSIAKRVCHNE